MKSTTGCEGNLYTVLCNTNYNLLYFYFFEKTVSETPYTQALKPEIIICHKSVDNELDSLQLKAYQASLQLLTPEFPFIKKKKTLTATKTNRGGQESLYSPCDEPSNHEVTTKLVNQLKTA